MSELALGTVQFGLAYGLAGRGAIVPEPEVREILEASHTGGIRTLDTAPEYGDIEARLGGLIAGLDFSVVSKISPLPVEATNGQAAGHVARSVERSLHRLGDRLSALLFHRADDLLGADGDALWRAAQNAAGGHCPIGVSCYDPGTLVSLRERYAVTVAQVPGNALDQRLAAPGVAQRLAGVDIHLRSIFLQGLLLLPPSEGAKRLPQAEAALTAWASWCRERALAPVTAALGLAQGLPGVSRCVVGVDRLTQLQELLQAWPLAVPATAPALASDDIDVIDPRHWKACA